MIDPKLLVDNPECINEELQKRGLPNALPHFESARQLYQQKHTLLVEVEEKRAKRNQLAQRIAASKELEREALVEEGKKLREQLVVLDGKLHTVNQELEMHLRELPNLSFPEVPAGGEEANREIDRWGEPPAFDFPIKDHVELAEMLGMLDMGRAAKVSGSRFAYLKGDAVLLELGLVDLAIKTLIPEGFIPVMPPLLIRKRTTEDLGYWHASNRLNYYLVSDVERQDETEKESPLYLIGTAEHAIVPMHSDEIFAAAGVPVRYVGFSSCFRREAGSYGKDVRGIIRVHQFDKVEMVSFCQADQAEAELAKLVELATGLMQKLKLPYRLVELAAGDLSYPAARTVDIETWIPSQNKYRETHSISTTTDYQSRRLNTRVRTTGRTEFVHILNGTAFAIGRIIVAIMENYQQADGSFIVPEVLRASVGKDRITPVSH